MKQFMFSFDSVTQIDVDQFKKLEKHMSESADFYKKTGRIQKMREELADKRKFMIIRVCMEAAVKQKAIRGGTRIAQVSA
ncbi:hypothetical protein [Alkalicoccobacillus plakortidis]|uniref:Uncharacterized protein n=1 Tax=Alkalicoccobacillus plakortidis TaxID=444060 RepID=A0ABT0XE20_9BACI|nr:hypothetical protein [Alkalicoccobacillus plakortidis]MCM2674055.1 hypothetical protein [Alkalicoccobacillus plakortidis]MCM2677732.1 hypothetical protein [Alkalicoccobacillus plakortidis]